VILEFCAQDIFYNWLAIIEMAMEDGGPQILGYVLGRERLAASVLERLAASDPQAELRSSGDFGQ